MVFEIKNKVALVTGGASGIGFQFALKLLEKGARGVTLADINSQIGSEAIKKIESKYGKNKAIFVKTDVTDCEQFEDAFKKTVETFKNIDILINNAGTMNDAEWSKMIDLNLKGTVQGVILGLEKYLPKYKSGSEAVIANIASIAGVYSFATMPLYTATKFAVNGLTMAWGRPAHYERTKVRVVSICPGATVTPLLEAIANKTLGPAYSKIKETEMDRDLTLQSPEQLAPGSIQVIEKAPSGTLWVIEAGESPYQYQMADRFKIPKVHLQ